MACTAADITTGARRSSTTPADARLDHFSSKRSGLAKPSVQTRRLCLGTGADLIQG
jgi:hypothetical protein